MATTYAPIHHQLCESPTCAVAPPNQWLRDGSTRSLHRTNRYRVAAWEVERLVARGHAEYADWAGLLLCRDCSRYLSDLYQH